MNGIQKDFICTSVNGGYEISCTIDASSTFTDLVSSNTIYSVNLDMYIQHDNVLLGPVSVDTYCHITQYHFPRHWSCNRKVREVSRCFGPCVL